eukprot:c43295_g1_i1 orf=606-2459(+)
MVARKPRIVIVGAGMAGLAAAHQLQPASCADNPFFDLTVLEASYRVGGRIYTSEFGGDQLELGATYIHGIEGSPIYDIAQRVGALKGDIPWERQDGFPEKAIVKAEGGLIVDPVIVEPIVDAYKKLMWEVRDKTFPTNNGCKNRSLGAFLREGLNTFMSQQGSVSEIERMILCNKNNHCISTGDHNSEFAWMDSLGWNTKSLQNGIFSMHELMERILTAADSLFDLDLESEKEYQDYPGEHITIGKGYVSVLNELASSLSPDTIKFGKKVQRFLWNCSQPRSGAPVLLYCEDGSLIEADHVIITISLGVLKAGTQTHRGVSFPGGLSWGEGAKMQVCRSFNPIATRICNECGPSQLFEPPLPSWKLEAVTRLGFGVVDKLFVQVHPKCEDQLRSHLQLIYRNDISKSGSIPWWMRKMFSLCPIYKGSSTLLAWFAGEEALEMESLTDEEVITGLVNTLTEFRLPQQSSVERDRQEATTTTEEFSDSNSDSWEESWSDDGEQVRQSGTDDDPAHARLRSMFHGVLRSSWGRNPLFLGSYSYVAVGSSGVDLDTMAEPLPKCGGESSSPPLQLLFAGEATDRHFYSTTHGAYRSGIREANRLLHHYGLAAEAQAAAAKR